MRRREQAGGIHPANAAFALASHAGIRRSDPHDDVPWRPGLESSRPFNLGWPFMDGFAGGTTTSRCGRRALLACNQAAAIYTTSSVTLQVLIGFVSRAGHADSASQWIFRIVAILPIVLAPVVVGLFWRTLMLSPNFGLVDYLVQAVGLEQVNWLGAPTPALISVIVIHTWQWTPFAFLVLLASLASLPLDVYEAARIDRANAFQRFGNHAALAASGDRHRGDHPGDDLALRLRGHLRRDGRWAGHRQRDPEPLCVQDLVRRAQLRLRVGARGLAAGDHDGGLRCAVLPAHRAAPGDGGVNVHRRARLVRTVALMVVASALLVVWVLPLIWAFVCRSSPNSEVLAYPPNVLFDAHLVELRGLAVRRFLDHRRSVTRRSLSTATTVLTILLAVPAAYAFARLRLPAKRSLGFYTLATQMVPPVGLVIPYFLILNRFGWLDTYHGMIVVYLTFSLPFAIWLMVSYMEDIPTEMEEAAFLDRASRLQTLWHIIIPQVRGGIAVTVIFIFLNAWNEFLFAVQLGGNTVRPR